MEKQMMTKPQVVEVVSIIHRRVRNFREFEEECRLYSWEQADAEKILSATPQVYQDRYNEILEGFKNQLLELANEIIEKEFLTCEVVR